MARSTRSAKRIHEYLVHDEAHFIEAENETEINADTHTETNADTSAAKKRKTDKPPKILDGKYFEITKLDGKKVEVICTSCKKLRKGDIDSTGNFMKHIKQSHPELVEEVELYKKHSDEDNVIVQKKVQKTIEQTMVQKCTLEDVSICCINLISECNLPFTVVQTESFKKLLETVARQSVSVPTKYGLINTLSTQYETIKSEMKTMIAAQDYVCTTADVWSSAAVSFFGMTLHFIDSNFVRRSMLLGFRQMKHKQTYIEITEMIRNILADFGISSQKVTHIITDGGSAFCKSFKKYGSGADALVEHVTTTTVNEIEDESDNVDEMPFIEYEDGEQFYSNILNLNESDEMNGNEESAENNDDFEFFDFETELSEERTEPPVVNDSDKNIEELPEQRRCLSHLLNLIANDFENDLSGRAKTCFINTMNKLQALWVFPRKSSQAKSYCKEILLCLLLIPCVTRWNSKYDAVEKVLKLGPIKIEKYINTLKQNMKSASHILSLDKDNWITINVYVKVMKPVAVALDRLQGEKDCSQAFILPTLYSMKHHLETMDGGALLKTFRDSMLKVIDKRFSAFFEINDANKQLLLASVSNPKFKTNFIENDVDCVFVKHLLTSACATSSNSNSSEMRQGTSTETSTDSFFISYATVRSNRRGSFEQCIENEVSNYLTDPKENYEMLREYPHIQNIFFKYNTTLASSAPVERVFSQSKIIFTPRRNRLHSETFEKLLFLKHNRKLLNIKYETRIR